MAEGIEVRVGKNGKRTYRASVWSSREGKLLRKSFKREAEAKSWRQDAAGAVRGGRMSATAAPTLHDAVSAWKAGAEAGTVRTRGRGVFSPSTIRAVDQNYRLRLAPLFGTRRLDRITLAEVQELVDELDADGMSASTIETTILPLRLVYRHARAKGVAHADPTHGLQLPHKGRGKRLPPSPADAAGLLAAAPEQDRAVWATAMLAGLRRGELMALRAEDVDLKAGRLRVERSYDPGAQEFRPPKSRQGRRNVPISSTLAPYLRPLVLARDGLLFGTGDRPFSATPLQERADAAWQAAGLERVTLHACRHLYASMSIAAGVNAHSLSVYMGHSGIQVTLDLYGHLFPGNETEASRLLDGYLAGAFVAADFPNLFPRPPLRRAVEPNGT
jgi:integrase